MCISEVLYGAFVYGLLHGIPPIFLEVVGVGCVCSYVVLAYLWFNSRPCLANASTCSLPWIFVWVFIVWSVINHV